MGFAGNEQI